MIFGEYEWLTEQHILRQINVNLLGTMRTTKSFCSMLRKYKGKYENKPCAFYLVTLTNNSFLFTINHNCHHSS